MGLSRSLSWDDVRVCSISLAKADAGSGRFERVHLEDIDFGDSRLRAVKFSDVIAERIDAANGDWGGAQLRCTRFSDARLTGLNFAEARIEEVSFKGCKLDYANFRHSAIKQVSFEGCVLTGADFQGASLDATLFSDCQLVEADFSKAKFSLVDLRGSELALAGSVLGLRGAIIDPLQLMELARTLAQELGIAVKDAGAELTAAGVDEPRNRCTPAGQQGREPFTLSGVGRRPRSVVLGRSQLERCAHRHAQDLPMRRCGDRSVASLSQALIVTGERGTTPTRTTTPRAWAACVVVQSLTAQLLVEPCEGRCCLPGDVLGRAGPSVEQEVNDQSVTHGDDRARSTVGIRLAGRGEVCGERRAELLLICRQRRLQVGVAGREGHRFEPCVNHRCVL